MVSTWSNCGLNGINGVAALSAVCIVILQEKSIRGTQETVGRGEIEERET